MSHRTHARGAARVSVLALTGLVFAGALLWLFLSTAHAAPYVNPWWTNLSTSPESSLPYIANLGMSPEGVDVRTGELMWDHFLFRTPGMIRDNVFALRWRSMISGVTQMGRQMLPSFEITAQYVLLIPGSPNAPNGHRVDIRRPSGIVDGFMWNGAAYAATNTEVYDTLTTAIGGNYILTDKHGNAVNFDAQGASPGPRPARRAPPLRQGGSLAAGDTCGRARHAR